MLKLLKRTSTNQALDPRSELQIRNLLDDPALQRAMRVAADDETTTVAPRRRLLRAA